MLISRNKGAIYAKIFKCFVSEGLFEDTDKARGSDSGLELPIKNLELESRERKKQNYKCSYKEKKCNKM